MQVTRTNGPLSTELRAAGQGLQAGEVRAACWVGGEPGAMGTGHTRTTEWWAGTLLRVHGPQHACKHGLAVQTQSSVLSLRNYSRITEIQNKIISANNFLSYVSFLR